MHLVTRLVPGIALALGAACSDAPIAGPDTEFGPAVSPAGSVSGITIMTRNMYVGTDVDAVIGALATADPDDDLPTLVAAIQVLERTDFARRAAAMADEIEQARPQVIGLQEVSRIDLTLPPLGVDLHYDFLPTLLQELSGRGLDYTVAAQTQNISAAPFAGVSLLDFDVLLVDPARVTVLGTSAGPFQANLGPVAPGVVLQRGWVSARVEIGGVEYTVASTHLESGDAAGLEQLRALQAGELVQHLAGSARVLLMGDFNDVPGSAMYQVLTDAGLADAWTGLRPGVSGFTCCHRADLSDQVPRFTKRIDFVLAGGLTGASGSLQGQAGRVGEVSADRVPGPDYPIWPSDHAGLVVTLSLPLP